MEQNTVTVTNVATEFAEALKNAKNFEELSSAATTFGDAVCAGNDCLMSELRNLNSAYIHHEHNPNKITNRSLIQAIRYAEGRY
jgi:hypothetical protein